MELKCTPCRTLRAEWSEKNPGEELSPWLRCQKCLDDHRARQEAASQKREREDTLKRAKVPEEFWDVEPLAMPPDHKWPVIHGPIGRAKTTEAVRYLLGASGSRLFISWPLFMEHRRAAAGGRDVRDPLFDALDIQTLLIDEIGAERKTAFSEQTAYMIIDHRWAHRRATIITTNDPDVEPWLGERAASRVSQRAFPVPKGGPDLRLVRPVEGQ